MVLLTTKQGHPIWVNPDHVVSMYEFQSVSSPAGAEIEGAYLVLITTDEMIDIQGDLTAVANLITAGKAGGAWGGK